MDTRGLVVCTHSADEQSVQVQFFTNGQGGWTAWYSVIEVSVKSSPPFSKVRCILSYNIYLLPTDLQADFDSLGPKELKFHRHSEYGAERKLVAIVGHLLRFLHVCTIHSHFSAHS